jgi:dTDP-4-dehydrorhamnose reductase
MKILLLGKGGQVGWELQRSLAPSANSSPSNSTAPTTAVTSPTLPDSPKPSAKVKPDVIVNAAAHTAVDKAESEPELVRTINALAPGVLADEAEKLGAWLIHYSTDYVFDGSGTTPWKETDATGPLGVYGQTKFEGEQAVARCARHLIFRTSWVYAARGANFAKTMLRLAKERDQLKVIADQIGAPTGAELLADVTAHAIRTVQTRPDGQMLAGLYHLVAGRRNELARLRPVRHRTCAGPWRNAQGRPEQHPADHHRRLPDPCPAPRQQPARYDEAANDLRPATAGRKGIILAGGSGTRLYPARRSSPSSCCRSSTSR